VQVECGDFEKKLLDFDDFATSYVWGAPTQSNKIMDCKTCARNFFNKCYNLNEPAANYKNS
jgi:hypothetical protein